MLQTLKTAKVKNMMISINTLAVPVICYCYNIPNWILNEVIKIHRKTIKIITGFMIHHPNSDLERLYIQSMEALYNEKNITK